MASHPAIATPHSLGLVCEVHKLVLYVGRVGMATSGEKETLSVCVRGRERERERNSICTKCVNKSVCNVVSSLAKAIESPVGV